MLRVNADTTVINPTSLFVQGSLLTLTQEQGDQIFDECGSRQLSIRIQFPQDYRYIRAFKPYGLLYIPHGSWVTRDNLISMLLICTEVVVYETYTTYMDVNQILRRWLGGEMSGLRSMIIDGVTYRERCFEGLDEKKINPKWRMEHTMWVFLDIQEHNPNEE
uniref:FBA_2 domain-containing protein n=1 Tax=Caenorhabditis tropicalis TaxID=1561998 RepID=A0A1I7USR4_9PELO